MFFLSCGRFSSSHRSQRIRNRRYIFWLNQRSHHNRWHYFFGECNPTSGSIVTDRYHKRRLVDIFFEGLIYFLRTQIYNKFVGFRTIFSHLFGGYRWLRGGGLAFQSHRLIRLRPLFKKFTFSVENKTFKTTSGAKNLPNLNDMVLHYILRA